MKKTLNIGVIGLGRLGSQYARYISSRLSGACLYAVADGLPKVLKKSPLKPGAAKAYANYHDLLADKARGRGRRHDAHQIARRGGHRRGEG